MKIAIIFLAGTFILFMLNGCAGPSPQLKGTRLGLLGAVFQKSSRPMKSLPQRNHRHSAQENFGFDIYSTPNVKIFELYRYRRNRRTIRYEDLSEGLARCIKVREHCQGYQVEPKVMITSVWGISGSTSSTSRGKPRGGGVAVQGTLPSHQRCRRR